MTILARRLGTTLVAACLIVMGVLVAPAHAEHERCGQYVPSKGSITTVQIPGVETAVTFKFQMSPADVKGLKCFAEYLEIDFHISGFKLPDAWERYRVSSNLPGAVPDVAFSDSGSDAVPAATGIRPHLLTANKTYFVTLTWYEPLKSAARPTVRINWVPSHGPWVYDPEDPFISELASCAKGVASKNIAWCIFPYKYYAYRLTETWFKNADHRGKLPFGGVRVFHRGL